MRAPQAVFAACVEAAVERVIQISALGSDELAQSAFHRSRVAADEFLLRLPLRATVVQPSLVFGAEGESSRAFMTLASALLIVLPGSGAQLIQPIHVDDVVEGLLVLLRSTHQWPARLAFVGPTPISLRDYLASLRRQLGLGTARFLDVPPALARVGARMAGGRIGILDPGCARHARARQRRRCNRSDGAARIASPCSLRRPVFPAEAPPLRAASLLGWLLPLLRASIAVVWIASGVLSFGVYPVELSYALLEAAGVSRDLAPFVLYSGASLNLAFGVATLALRKRRALWLAQVAVIVLYTGIITFTIQELWLHPFGPILKNLPMLAAILVVLELERY